MSRGVPPPELDEDDLLRELERLHSTRWQTFRHGSDDALAVHSERTRELEAEYLRRHPEREVDPDRTRRGARMRAADPSPAGAAATPGAATAGPTDSSADFSPTEV